MFVHTSPLKALGYQQITSLSSSTALTVPAGTQVVIMKPAAQAVRFRDDGTAPTGSIGYPIAVGTEYIYTAGSPAAIRVIESAASATLDVLYYG
jgi:hypothetical protein